MSYPENVNVNVNVNENASPLSFNFDKSSAAQRRSSSLWIAEHVVSVEIKPQLTDTGIIEYGLVIEYTPDSRFSKATLSGKISLDGVVDSTEYIVKNGAGVWEASYEERWKGEYVAVTIDDATDDESRIEFSVVYYTNPMTAIHNLMAKDPAEFFDMEKDDLGNLPEV